MVNTTNITISEVNDLLPFVQPGGANWPMLCKSPSRVAIVVAFRDREQHLGIFLRHLHPFLQRQLLDYRIFIVQMVRYDEIRFISNHNIQTIILAHSQIARIMGSTWGPPGSCRPQIGPMLVPWTLLSGLGYWLIDAERACLRHYGVIMGINHGFLLIVHTGTNFKKIGI